MIEVEKLTVVQGAFRLQELSFRIPDGSYGILMGRTGSGKTTTLEVIAGLKSPASGAIRLHDRDVGKLPAWQRGVGYVPQDLALFSTMTVRQHLGFAMHVRKRPENEQRRRIEELAHWLQITPLLDRRPANLSGGEAQRVALGRALSSHPDVLLLDEPLSSLDEATREPLLHLLERLPGEQGVTVLHVTHNRVEAERLGDVILRLEAGRIDVVEQIA